MRSTIIAAAAFAVSAAAVPFAEPDVVTAYATDVVYVTNVVTVTEGAPAATVAAADTTTTYAPQGGNGWGSGWHWPHGGHSSKSKKHKTRTKTRTRTAAPPPSTPTTTWEQPAPTYEAPTTAAPEPTTSAPEPSNVSGYNAIVVAHHNVHRANHSAPDVQWDDGLASIAATIASSCVYAHDTTTGGGGYGQNIAAGVESSNVSAIITDLFYNGEVGYYNGMYGEANPNMAQFELWGHFSQIVWKNTEKVGCATQYCPGGLANTAGNVSPYFTVCNYSPPGNYGGEYGDNVGSPKNEPTVNWNYAL